MRINQQLLIKVFLSMVACCMTTGCIDDNYDLSDIDKSSRINVNNLTVPVRLQEIKLENVLDLDDNENISTVEINGKKCYAIHKSGDISTSDLSIDGIHVPSVPIKAIDFSVSVPDIPSIPGLDVDMDIEVHLPDLPLQEYHINMDKIDSSLRSLLNIKSLNNITIDVDITVPKEVINDNTEVSFRDLALRLPWGLLTDLDGYDRPNGNLTISKINVGSDGKVRFSISASGIDLYDKGNIINQTLEINDKIGVEGGKIHFKTGNVKLPNPFPVKIEFSISSFDIASFSGDVVYKMDDISIAPVSLSDLPDFLNSPETEIHISDPNILLDINNPVGNYGLIGKGSLKLTSHFNNEGENGETVAESGLIQINEEGTKVSIGSIVDGYFNIECPNLGNILVNENIGGIPENISVKIENLEFSGIAKDLPVGSSLGNAVGEYVFNAPLGFCRPSTVVYKTTVDGWGSEDLDKVNITKINVTANCVTNLPVGVSLTLNPVDRNGNIIPIKENSKFDVGAFSNKKISLSIESADSQPIHGLDGISFIAIITQDNPDPNFTQALGPDQYIKLDNIRVNVDGYYDYIDD